MIFTKHLNTGCTIKKIVYAWKAKNLLNILKKISMQICVLFRICILNSNYNSLKKKKIIKVRSKPDQ